MKRRKSRSQAGSALGYAALLLAISVLVAGQPARADELQQQSVLQHLQQQQDGASILSSVDSGWFKDPVERVREGWYSMLMPFQGLAGPC